VHAYCVAGRIKWGGGAGKGGGVGQAAGHIFPPLISNINLNRSSIKVMPTHKRQPDFPQKLTSQSSWDSASFYINQKFNKMLFPADIKGFTL
jgi:hypothetical protein